MESLREGVQREYLRFLTLVFPFLKFPKVR